jgi:hypothetical protein
MLASRKMKKPRIPSGALIAPVPLGVPTEAAPIIAPGQAQPADLSQLTAANPTPKRGMFAGIGDFIRSDDGRAALLRSGAATLQGGLGAGILAGAEEMDRRKAAGIASRRYADELGLKTASLGIDKQRADQEGEYRQGQVLATMAGVKVDADKAASTNEIARGKLELDRAELAEAIRKNRNGEALTARQIDVLERNNIRTTDASRYGVDSARVTALGNRAQEGAPTKRAVAIAGGGKPASLNVTATAANPMAPATQILPDGTRVVFDPMSGRWVPF